MTLAMIGALILLFGSLKVFVWVNRRLVLRQQSYNATRRTAANSDSAAPVGWEEPSESLDLFH